MPMMKKYTVGELRAWNRGYRARRLGKLYRCRSRDLNYLAAWKAGWFAASKMLGLEEGQRRGTL